MAGERKRDFPCNMWYQQPWWPQNEAVDGYLGRLCALMSQGQMVPELLVLHPIESLYPVRRPPTPDQGAWDTYHANDAARIVPLDEGFQALSHYLLGHQRQFDYGDETILADVGTVDASGERPLLRVGAMSYPLVLLPNLTSIRVTTLELLEAFATAGGPILAVGTLPTLLDGRVDGSDRLAGFLRARVRRVAISDGDVRFAPMAAAGASAQASACLSAPHDPGEKLDDLKQSLDALAAPMVTVDTSGSTRWLWQHTRRIGDVHAIMLANLHRAEPVAGTLRLGPAIHGPLIRLDLAANTAAVWCEGEGAVPPYASSYGSAPQEGAGQCRDSGLDGQEAWRHGCRAGVVSSLARRSGFRRS
jgi:hypothetical protein